MIIFLLLLATHFLVLSRLTFTAWPEMFSYSYFLNQNFKLYQDIALPYEPLLPILLSVIYKLLGYSLINLQITTWVAILVSDVLLFIILKKILSGVKLFIPVVLYVILQPLAGGNLLWFDLATVPFILAGVVCLLYLEGSKKFFWLGVFLSLAFLIKQQVGISVMLLAVYFVSTKNLSKLLSFFAGFAFPILGTLVYVLANGTISQYLFWTVTVPFFWYPKFPGYAHWPTFKESMILAFLFGPILIYSISRIRKISEEAKISLLLLLGAAVSAFPRFEFFRIQPAIALSLVVLGLIFPKKVSLQILLILPLVITGLFLGKNMLQTQSTQTRFHSQEDLKLAGYIKKMGNTVYLLGVSSLQYVLANKTTPKPWVDNYIWYMEIPGVQERVLAGFEKNPPEVILRQTPQPGNWFDLGTYQPQKIVDFIKNNYRKVDDINNIEIWKKRD